MGFRAVVRKTLIDLTGWKRTLILLVLGLLVPVISGVAWRSNLLNAGLSPEMAKYDLLERFIGISFIWTCGLFLAFAVVTSAAGAISKESNDGTLLTLVSKPIARRQIVLGKFAGIVIHSLLMITVILLIQAVILWFLLPVEAPTFGALLLAIPWLILYSLLVILVFASISLALSSLIDNQVVITVLACGLIFFTFLFGSISNMMFMMKPQAYENNYVYMIDGSYQFGNAFAPALEQALGGEMLPPRELEEITLLRRHLQGGQNGGYVWWLFGVSVPWRAGQLRPACCLSRAVHGAGRRVLDCGCRDDGTKGCGLGAEGEVLDRRARQEMQMTRIARLLAILLILAGIISVGSLTIGAAATHPADSESGQPARCRGGVRGLSHVPALRPLWRQSRRMWWWPA